MRLNVRFIYASQFLRQFRLNVKHKFNKKHIVFNALSRLVNIIKSLLFENHLKLDVLYACATQILKDNNVYVYSATIIQINKTFYKRFIFDYNTNNH